METTIKELLSNLAQFSGTEGYKAHNIGGVKLLLTDGVVYLAKTAEAWWLIDVIASHQVIAKIRAEKFQAWKLQRSKDKESWTVTCEDGNNKFLCMQNIPYSDFPLDSIALWKSENVVMLPSEY